LKNRKGVFLVVEKTEDERQQGRKGGRERGRINRKIARTPSNKFHSNI
jgi:hypothetical protein